MTCEKCGSTTHRDDAMNRRCDGCECLVRQCVCEVPTSEMDDKIAEVQRRNNRVDEQGRKLVACDWDDCIALDDPQTLDEYKLACEHWREHNYLSGCSHGA